MKKLIFITFLCAICGTQPMWSQGLTQGLRFEVSANTTFSGGDYTPFWLVANRYGLSSVEKNNGYLRAGIFKPAETRKRFTYAYGLDLAVPYRFTSPFVIQQAYVQFNYWALGLQIGSKEEESAMKNSYLSAGGLTQSTNARPIPQVRIGFLDYTLIPHTKWLYIKGWFSYGRFTDDWFQRDYIGNIGQRAKGVIYHNKSLFLKADSPNFPLFGEVGAVMSAEFGGRVFHDGVMSNLPSGLTEYFKAFIPLKGGSNSPIFDQTNVNGNQVGSWLFSLGYRFPEWKVRAYYEHFYEDHSMMFWQYPWYDGQIGLEITLPQNPFVHTFLYEYLGMKDQSGPVYHDSTPDIPEQISAVDDYYNHGIYPGWQHWGMGIGSPLVISPLYNKSRSLYFSHNRIKSHHFGLSGNPSPEWQYRLLATLIRSWGTYRNPTFEIERDFSVLAELSYTPFRAPGWSFTGALAFDRGEMMGNNMGVMFSVKKSGLLNRWFK